MRILVATGSLGDLAGGAERQALMLVNELAERGHEAHLLSRDTAQAQAFYPIDARVVWHKQNFSNPNQKASIGARLARALATRALMKSIRPQLVVCFQIGIFSALKAYCLGQRSLGHIGPMVAAERISPFAYTHLHTPRKRALLWKVLGLADLITVQCPSYVQAYPKALQTKMRVIPNPVLPAPQQAEPRGQVGQTKRLVCVARLCFQKNQAVLIRAFGQIANRHADWHLDLVGDGPDKAPLGSLIAELGLQARVTLWGAQAGVTDFYARSHAFCLPSHWEGFPNALSEALAHGLPSIGFADCAGVSDLIEDGKTGYLAAGLDDVQSLATCLDLLLGQDALRADMSERARASIAAYEPRKVYDLWEQTLLQAGQRA